MAEKHAINILVLDDELFMLKLLGRMLANLGYTRVSLYDNGQDALVHMDGSDEGVNLILLDLNMPGMDGVEFVRHLVERNYGGSLLLISGEDAQTLQTAEKLMEAQKITVLGHLHKPISYETLSVLLDKWLPLELSSSHKASKSYSAAEVYDAIHNNELVNYYQPIVAVASGEVVGMETLVRWRHPQDGIVLPEQFIGVAEANNLIHDLTRVVLVAALGQTKVWQQAGLLLRVAINVSENDLDTLDFPDFVARLAAKAGVQAQQLVLEVTEDQLLRDQRTLLDILTRLRLKRFRLAIDDFGSGNSTLAHLRDIPLDEVKIDHAFVHGAHANEARREMYDASLKLARQLKIGVVAVGVEDRADWDFLNRTGCDFAQGYFIARPMPAADVQSWVEDWNERVGGFAVEG